MRLEQLDEKIWQAAWESLPADRQEVYYSPAYHAICARWERATPHCLRVTGPAGWMLYPYLAHPTPDTRHDVQTAYGYGGPLFVEEWAADQRAAALADVGAHFRERG